MADHDAIVIGAGHNGLVAAAYLAKAGLKVLVLERRSEIGGTLASHEIAPGVKAPALFHTMGRLRPSVIKDLKLAGHGLSLIESPVRVFAPQPDGSAVTLWADAAKTSVELRERSVPDAEAYPAFDQRIRSLASFLAYIAAATPPDVETPSLGDAIAGLKMGKAFRSLGAKAGREAIRAIPMAIADYVGETFETEALRGALAARAVQFVKQGPWSAGTTAHLLMDSAGNEGGAAGQATFARGGPGALAEALASAARGFGTEIRLGAEVDHVSVNAGGRVSGVVLRGGEEISARAVVSSADPKTTLVDWVDPVVLGPHLRWRAGNIRTPGVVAKVNLVLSGVPRFNGAEGDERLRGRIVIGPSIDYIEHAFDAAKYGRVSAEPFLEATIPSLSDPTIAPEGKHVMSVLVQWAPYALREGDWEQDREGLGDLVLKTLESYAPGLSGVVTAREVLTPVDLERELGLPQGHPLHAEPGLDSFFAWRPLLGHARYRYGLPGLYLCGSGAHPGGGITGAPGANAAKEIISDLK